MMGRFMLLASVAWRNLWRSPRRTILSLAGLAFAVALVVFMLSFQLSTYAGMKENTLRVFDGYAQLQAKGFTDDPTIERTIADPKALARQAVAIDGVTQAAPRIMTFAILANGERTFGASIVGVDPEREAHISSIAGTIRKGRYLRATDNDAAVLGQALARNLNIKVGDKITLLGTGHDGSIAADVLKVVGIFASGVPEIDRSMLEMPITRAASTFSMQGLANTIALEGPSLDAVNAAGPALHALALRHGVDFLDWQALEPSMRGIILLDMSSSLLLYFALIIVVAFIILNTLLMSVLERTREFGILLALGMRSRQIGIVVWIEQIALALLGGLIGFAIGGGVTLWLGQHGMTLPGGEALMAEFGMPSRIYPVLTPLSALLGPCTILFTIILGGIVPYLRVSRLTPAIAMRAP